MKTEQRRTGAEAPATAGGAPAARGARAPDASGVGLESGPPPAKRIDRENVRSSLGADAIAEALIDNLHYVQAKSPPHATLLASGIEPAPKAFDTRP